VPRTAELIVRCLENEGVEWIFGLPGEENIDLMDALLDSRVRFLTTRHEQGAAFIADVYGRLTGRPGVCLSTLGPGATNLMTGVADANMDRAPLVALVGQGSTRRMHKESHQILDLVRLFEPVTKYAAQLRDPHIVPEVVRKAFKVAATEKPGATMIEIPENVAKAESADLEPLRVQSPKPAEPARAQLQRAHEVLENSRRPLILAGNGVIRGGASGNLQRFAERLNIPVATTFMAKGVVPASHPLSLGTVGLQARDYAMCGFDRADAILCVGFDMVEYHPHLWNPEARARLVHIDPLPAEVDAHYIVEVGLLGDIGASLDALADQVAPFDDPMHARLRDTIAEHMNERAEDSGFPIKPQRIIHDLRGVLAPEDIVISDVGAHKMWMARMYPAERPNTCLIANGFAAMGIAVPGAIAASLVHPERTVVAVTGDAGFLMNSQEIETAMRAQTPIVILIWNDSKYGLIEWHQMRHLGRPSHIDFNNPDFVRYAESFGARGYRVEAADELVPCLRRAISDRTVAIIDCPVDYSENMALTRALGELVCPV